MRYRPGTENIPADVMSRDCLNLVSKSKECQRIVDAHSSLCHPGVERLWQYVKDRKWPVTLEEVRAVVSECQICSKVKPRFCKTDCHTLIKASRPWERIAIDFKGPVPKSKDGNEYLLIMVDEYSRFPLAFPCRTTAADSVISALSAAFSIFGLPENVHSDRGSSFVSLAVRNFLKNKGIHISNSCPYHPEGNGQCERYVGTIWKSVELALEDCQISWEDWELVLPDALHSIRSLICTSTRETPHSRIFSFERKSTSGPGVPKWLLESEGSPIWVRNFSRRAKSDPRVKPATLIEAFPRYARVEFENGRIDSISLDDIAPKGSYVNGADPEVVFESKNDTVEDLPRSEPLNDPLGEEDIGPEEIQVPEQLVDRSVGQNSPEPVEPALRRSGRSRRPPERFGDPRPLVTSDIVL